MGLFKALKIKNAFKKGNLLHVSDVPLKVERDTLLVQQSTDRNIPIVVGKQDRVDELRFFNDSVEILRIAPTYTIEFKDREFDNGVLIDQSVSDECLQLIREKNIKISGGFRES